MDRETDGDFFNSLCNNNGDKSFVKGLVAHKRHQETSIAADLSHTQAYTSSFALSSLKSRVASGEVLARTGIPRGTGVGGVGIGWWGGVGWGWRLGETALWTKQRYAVDDHQNGSTPNWAASDVAVIVWQVKVTRQCQLTIHHTYRPRKKVSQSHTSKWQH